MRALDEQDEQDEHHLLELNIGRGVGSFVLEVIEVAHRVTGAHSGGCRTTPPWRRR